MSRAELGHHVFAHFVSDVIVWIVLVCGTSMGALFLGLTTGLDRWQRDSIVCMFGAAIICTAIAAYALGSRRRLQRSGPDAGSAGGQQRDTIGTSGIIPGVGALHPMLTEDANRLLYDLERIEIGSEGESTESLINFRYPLKVDQFPPYPDWTRNHVERMKWQVEYGCWRNNWVRAGLGEGVPALGAHVHIRRLQRMLTDIQHGIIPVGAPDSR